MILRLKTSKETQEIFAKIGQTTGLQPYALSKLAISMSINSKDRLTENDFLTNNDGLDLNRQTICGEYDSLISILIANYEQIKLDEDTIFPKYFKAHIDRGAKLLLNEYKYDKNFYSHLANLNESI